jgi:hypothetical protein
MVKRRRAGSGGGAGFFDGGLDAPRTPTSRSVVVSFSTRAVRLSKRRWRGWGSVVRVLTTFLNSLQAFEELFFADAEFHGMK